MWRFKFSVKVTTVSKLKAIARGEKQDWEAHAVFFNIHAVLNIFGFL